jgi:DNA-binding NtrC family response regulator
VGTARAILAPPDIPLLATQAIADVAKRLNIEAPTLAQAEAERLQRYDWTGNVRELQNIVERAVILSKGGGSDWMLHSPTRQRPRRRYLRQTRTRSC